MKIRKLGPNLIKFIAIFSVFGVHFILNTMDAVRINGPLPEFIYFTYRQVFIICVPLFMLATGYLNVKQDVSKRYYQKLLPIVGIYLLYSILSLLFRNLVLDEGISFLRSIFLILNFKASPYNWYLSMYVGLFLLSPFLNKTAQSLTQKQLQWLLLCLIALTILPVTVNVFTFTIFQEPGILVTNFWVALYPVTYYFTGLYLRNYPLKRIPYFLLILIAFTSVFVSMYFSVDGQLSQVTKDYANVLTYVQSIFVFAALIDIQNDRLNESRFVQFVAAHTLDIYLVSFISDRIVYQFGSSLLQQSYHDFLYAPLFVIGSFILAVFMVKIVKMALSLLPG